ncbi:trans-aconitate 2-methyltransferase [Chelatococcus sambhunathii]|uniref:Trans-aconitate 2-methyltransferase n=1 Tax=Chelatococcus sambhunathii TaxID=363953 RepID=A0ABU1DIM1_9HYPH|nr:trans-aconitate 2-methyltransferase [Chelatococcus sambhunathii]MDR4307958.1 trans-aconitate 2-methyltransferase [Chelatococcus sambhunathii]
MSLKEDWSASTYLRFEDERTRPAADLLARVPLTEAKRVFDLGCGPGNSTELLKARFPGAEIAGVDSSPDMLASARKRLPDVDFIEGDIATWTPERAPDVIFANAALQWLGEHETLFPRLLKLLAPGGALAVQMPDNLSEPSHAAMREVARDGAWAERLAGSTTARTEILSGEAYFDLLAPYASQVDVWRTTYLHPLDGAEAIATWLKATGLRPFLDPLDETERERFLALYTERIRAFYPERATGKALLRFPRLFIVALRK